MTGIRALARKDVEQVASLYELTMGRSASRRAAPALAPYLERVFLDNAWVDPEIPSLVATDDHDGVIGFLGVTVRPMVFDGRRVRLAASGPFATDPEHRKRGLGGFLLRRFLSGPQDLSISDYATETTSRLYSALGGGLAPLSSIRWLYLFRPLSGLVDYADQPDAWPVRLVPRPLLGALDTIVSSVGRRAFRAEIPDGPALEEEPLTPAALLEHLPAVAGSLRLRPDYDRPYLEWLFGELAEVRGKGTLRARLVRDARRGVLGWYVCHLKPGGLCRVLQIAASGQDVGRVLQHLCQRTAQEGGAGVMGRLEPRLVEPLARRNCLMFSRSYAFAVVHSRNPEISCAIHAGHALLTRLEGESWMDFLGRSLV